MTPERWQQIRDLLHSAMELEPAERSAYLERHCSDDPSLRKDVDSFLASEEDLRSSFLESPAVAQVVPGGRFGPGMTLAAGTKLGRYEIVELLGAGGMGEVYRARDTELPRTVAIKVLPSHLSSDPLRRQRFEREVHAISSLQHPNICTLHDVGHQNGADFLVMEYLEGGTLASKLQKGPLPLEQVLRYGIEIADALDTAHRHGIIHRDLKPGNIFLTSHGECKVLDFGLAKLEEEVPSSEMPTLTQPGMLTSPGEVVGTVAYMSPEQARGEQLDTRTDIFSLGAVLYEMATGRLAFPGKTAAISFKAILAETPPPPTQVVPALPHQLDQIVGKALEKDRDLRYQSAADVRADLQRLKRDSESQRAVAVGVAVPVRWSRQAYRIAGVLAGVVAAGLVGVYFFLHRGGSSTRLAASNFQNMKIVQLTDSGKIGTAAISPDGRYVAYSVRDGSQRSLWVRQVATESAVNIVPVSDGRYSGLAFSPDADYLYFLRDRRNEDAMRDAYVVPVLGGVARLLVQDVDAGLGVSPDGKKVAFIRGLMPRRSQLLVANSDGSDERVVCDPVKAKLGKFWSYELPSWSRDGKWIASAINSETSGTSVFICPAEGGAPLLLPFANAFGASWLPDQSGLLVNAKTNDQHAQIWLQPYPKGEAQRITNDLSDYFAVTITTDGKQFAAMQDQESYSISVGAPSQADQPTPFSTNKSDGLALAWMPDGQLLSKDMQSRFWLTQADGKDRVMIFDGERQLPFGGFSICGSGSFLLLTRFNGGIWRVDITGGNYQALSTDKGAFDPDCSPEGNSMIYSSSSEKGSILMRGPIAGGTLENLLGKTYPWVLGRYSPDGEQIGLILLEEEGSPQITLAVMNSRTRVVERTFRVPFGALPDNSQGGLRWTPDGKALLFPLERQGTTDLWMQSVSGGPPRQLTHSGHVVAYAWSPDGTRLAVARSTTSSDVVVFRNFH